MGSATAGLIDRLETRSRSISQGKSRRSAPEVFFPLLRRIRVFGRRPVEAPRRTQEKTSGTQCSTHLNFNEKLITANGTCGGKGNVNGDGNRKGDGFDDIDGFVNGEGGDDGHGDNGLNGNNVDDCDENDDDCHVSVMLNVTLIMILMVTIMMMMTTTTTTKTTRINANVNGDFDDGGGRKIHGNGDGGEDV